MNGLAVGLMAGAAFAIGFLCAWLERGRVEVDRSRHAARVIRAARRVLELTRASREARRSQAMRTDWGAATSELAQALTLHDASMPRKRGGAA